MREEGQVTTLVFEDSVVPSPVHNATNGVLATPRDARLTDLLDSALPIPTSTPSFKTGSRLSSNSFPDSFVNPFVSEDGSVAGRGRKRTKFGRHSGAWRLIDNDEDEGEQPPEVPSPVPSALDQMERTIVPTMTKDTVLITEHASTPQIPVEASPQDLTSDKIENPVSDAGSPQQSLAEIDKSELTEPSPYVSSPCSSPEHRIRIKRPSLDSQMMPTPRLQALASPGLSIVSPLVQRSQYFPTFETTVSELDASFQKHDQAVFADSSSDLDEPADTDQLDFGASDPLEVALIDQTLDGPNSETAFLQVSTLGSDEIDLDALQEQIDRSNATPIPIEEVEEAIEEVVEDADMYGPPVDAPPDQPSDIIYPSLGDLDEQPFEQTTVLPVENPVVAEQTPVSVEVVEMTAETQTIIPEPVTNPLPSILDNAVRDLEFFARDYETVLSNDEIQVVEVTAPEISFFPRRNQSGSQAPRFLDGSVDIDHIPSQSPLTSQPEQDVELIEAGPLPAPQVIPDAPVEIVSDHVAIESVPASFTGTENGPFSPLPESRRGFQSEEQIQADESAIATADTLEAIDTPQLQESSPSSKTQPLAKPARRKSQRLLTKPGGLKGVYSEYFTPTKVSRVHGSSPIQSLPITLQEDAVDVRTDAPETAIEEAVVTSKTHHQSLHNSTTTEVGFYVHLTQLAEYHNQVVDVIAVCITDSAAPERAKSGPKDFHTTLQLVNASEEPRDNARIVAQIFRPRKNVLPHTRRGDVIALRNFLVQSISRRPMLLSTDASAWAVFPSEDELRHDSNLPTITSGPPIELGSGEESLANSLFSWWKDEGAAQNPEPAKPTIMDHDTPSHARPVRQTRKSRSELPAPLDLRRSPRKVRQEYSQADAAHPERRQDRSPSFQPFSPVQSSMAPPAAPAAASPSLNQLKAGQVPRNHESHDAENELKEQVVQNISSLEQKSTFPRRHTRSTSRASMDMSQSSPFSPFQDDPQTTESYPIVDLVESQTSTPFRQNLSGSASENNSVSGETSSSRRRRHERRSTSLIHELRDGTRWIDVEDSEIVSVSASESDEEQTPLDESMTMSNGAQIIRSEDFVADQIATEEDVETGVDNRNFSNTLETEQPELPTTPVRHGRGRPRKEESQRSPPSTRSNRHARVLSHGSVSGADESITNTSPQSTNETGPQRVTRSRQKVSEQEKNMHELRDGAKYSDQ